MRPETPRVSTSDTSPMSSKKDFANTAFMWLTRAFDHARCSPSWLGGARNTNVLAAAARLHWRYWCWQSQRDKLLALRHRFSGACSRSRTTQRGNRFALTPSINATAASTCRPLRLPPTSKCEMRRGEGAHVKRALSSALLTAKLFAVLLFTCKNPADICRWSFRWVCTSNC